MIYISGDTHGGFQRFGMKYFPAQKNMSRGDYMIICGDFGGVWNGSTEENYWLDWLEDKPFTTLFADGNHENYSMMSALPTIEWHGGKVHQVRENILHLTRGQIFDIDGLTWFVMGGARSHDIEDGILDPASTDFEIRRRELCRQGRKRFRVLGQSWWPEELPSDREYAEALTNLEKAEWCVDCILTHCAPTSIAQKIDQHNEADQLTDFLESVKNRCQFAYWFLGHYHRNQIIDQKYILQWEQISKIE